MFKVIFRGFLKETLGWRGSALHLWSKLVSRTQFIQLAVWVSPCIKGKGVLTTFSPVPCSGLPSPGRHNAMWEQKVSVFICYFTLINSTSSSILTENAIRPIRPAQVGLQILCSKEYELLICKQWILCALIFLHIQRLLRQKQGGVCY